MAELFRAQVFGEARGSIEADELMGGIDRKEGFAGGRQFFNAEEAGAFSELGGHFVGGRERNAQQEKRVHAQCR